jgi:hypothetical protein
MFFRRFILRLTLFCAPLVTVYAALTMLSVHQGEALPLPFVVERQREEQVLYGPHDHSVTFAYKFLSVQASQPRVITTGSSRTLQIRSEFFNLQPDSFFNAGVYGADLADNLSFLAAMDPATFPDVVILELDQPLFIGDTSTEAYPVDEDILAFDLDDIFAGHNRTMQALLRRRISVGELLNSYEPVFGLPALGLDAVTVGHGFRSDGSLQYGEVLINPSIIQTRQGNHRRVLNRLGVMYRPGDAVAESSLRVLDEILALIESRGAVVVGFSPPFHPDFYAVLMSDGHHAYLSDLEAQISPVFENHGFTYFDFSNPELMGATVSDFWDGWHSSELINLRIYMHMVDALPDEFAPYSDPVYLQQASENVVNTFSVFTP